MTRDPLDVGPYPGRYDLNVLYVLALTKTAAQLRGMADTADRYDREHGDVYRLAALAGSGPSR